MNTKEAKKLANFIEDRTVDMRWWIGEGSKDHFTAKTADECGTTCCCGGHYASMRHKKYKKYAKDLDDKLGAIADFAQEGLGLTPNEAHALFYPSERYDLEHRKPFQKQRLLEVLRGERPLNYHWLTP